MSQVDDALAPLPSGMVAPQFTLRVTPERTTSLADWLGSPIVLIFYPSDFNPVCIDELAVFNELMPIFSRRSAKLFGISVDNVWSHMALARELKLRFPLLADFHPKGAVTRAYNAWREQDGTSERGLYVIDQAGLISWSHLSPINVNPGADGVLEALDRLGGPLHAGSTM
jgi:peroxiredoxin